MQIHGDMLPRTGSLRSFSLFLLGFYYFSSSYAGGKGGRTASKVGLAGITQLASSSSSQQSSSDYSNGKEASRMFGEDQGMEQMLKNSLFGNRRYDKAVRPVKNSSDVVLVYIDFTYMQVLDLNEKDQTLTSLIRYRLYWKDQFLVWNPKDFNGIKNLWLPTSDVWIPDIVCYEDTGSRDYTPRLPYLVVHYDGTVRYLEPTEYKTTCHVNISHFPFDVQVCSMTFVSWTFPTSQVDLMAKRGEEAVQADIPVYFADTGEWRLDDITIEKFSQSFLMVLPDAKGSNNITAEERAITESQFYEISPTLPVREVAAVRVSNSHWSDVKYSLKFRRNSSLYVQSMLFPAILLTTISLIGFYLPPDSGERIGLQITILLTFMVFILTVGDMFPASTGPYLGVYFVLCMALLGLNIIMTVLVLYLHYIPINTVTKTDPDTGVSTCVISILPLWVKGALFLSGVYHDIEHFTVNPDGEIDPPPPKEENSTLQRFRRLFKRVTNRKSLSVVTTPCNGVTSMRHKNGAQAYNWGRVNGTYKNKTIQTNGRFGDICCLSDNKNSDLAPPTDNKNSKRSNSKCIIEEAFADEMRQISRKLSALTKHADEHCDATNSSNVESTMEEKWRWVARKVDMTCMRVYIACLIVFHVGIVLAVFLNG